jgi:hypothetical protein
VALAACAGALEPATLTPAPVAPLDSIEVALFLIGDAGSSAYDGEPVLQDLARQSDSLRPVKQFVVFLGDNVYPRGVPPAGHPNRDDAEKKIAAQVLAIRKGEAQGILIPGNHDWDRQGRDGWTGKGLPNGARNLSHSDPSPNNPDLRWLRERTTSRK